MEPFVENSNADFVTGTSRGVVVERLPANGKPRTPYTRGATLFTGFTATSTTFYDNILATFAFVEAPFEILSPHTWDHFFGQVDPLLYKLAAERGPGREPWIGNTAITTRVNSKQSDRVEKPNRTPRPGATRWCRVAHP